MRENEQEKGMWIFWPLGYRYRENKEIADDSQVNVFSRSCEKVDEHVIVARKEHYALAGGYYHGYHGFYVVKNEAQYNDVHSVIDDLRTLVHEKNQIQFSQQALQHEARYFLNQDESAFHGDRLAYLHNEIRKEHYRIKQEDFQKKLDKFRQKTEKVKHAASRLNFHVSDAVPGNAEKTEEAIRQILSQFAELRWQEDMGSYFYRKEKFYNGNYHWNFMHFLAGGSKNGNKEQLHILHFLYQYRKNGTRTEQIIFPFITKVTDQEDYHFSFLWRLFSLRKKDNNINGHIFFIPFNLSK